MSQSPIHWVLVSLAKETEIPLDELKEFVAIPYSLGLSFSQRFRKIENNRWWSSVAIPYSLGLSFSRMQKSRSLYLWFQSQSPIHWVLVSLNKERKKLWLLFGRSQSPIHWVLVSLAT